MDALDLITRFGVSPRLSLAVQHNGTGYFAVTPKAPYDGALPIAEQARQLFEKLDGRLAELGSARDRLLLVAIVIADAADIPGFNIAWDQWLDGTPPPARGLIVSGLSNPAMRVELVVICAAEAAAGTGAGA